ncbi:ASCH domain-containing protein [Ruania albidiflava]|uniref:ASCH domain-containing protein n=1 Tax=Ruania albidiflava TaxID=366586 RepID=UPI0023F4B142|nr:ASCH domain-containing protein [Ruania albidiflava]
MSEEIDVFWQVARVKGRVAELEPVVGQLRSGTLPPPAFAFSADPGEADRMAGQVLDGSCTELSTPREEFPEEDLPKVGDLAIVLDGGAHPRALIRTVAVEQVEQEGRPAVTERFRVLYPRRARRVREPVPAR